MGIQIIKNSASFEPLEAVGPVKRPLGQPVPELRVARRTIPGLEQFRTGIWECSPGTYIRDIMEGEVIHVLSGQSVFTPDNGDPPVEMAAGDTVFFPANTTGTWNIKSVVRKMYVLFP